MRVIREIGGERRGIAWVRVIAAKLRKEGKTILLFGELEFDADNADSVSYNFPVLRWASWQNISSLFAGAKAVREFEDSEIGSESLRFPDIYSR